MKANIVTDTYHETIEADRILINCRNHEFWIEIWKEASIVERRTIHEDENIAIYED